MAPRICFGRRFLCGRYYCRVTCENTVLFQILDNKEKFELGIKKAVEVFTSIGIVVVIEDFFMPMCFWSQLPGNFRYIARKSYNATSFVGAFNSIHNKHIGLYNGSIWGPPVSIFKNFNGRHYYFNFHTGKNGNTLVIGPKGSGKSTLVKFLLTQSLKLKPRIVYINVEDLHGSEFMDAINGKTLTVKSAVNSEIKIDIFNVANFENNFEFFENTLWDILSSNRESMASEKNSFSEMLKQLADIKQKDQREAMLKEYIEKNKSLRISEALKALLSSDFYNFLLNEDSVISVDNIDILNIDLTSLYNAERLADEFIGLILIKLQKILDQRLTIISLNHCHEILCSDVFSKVLPKWLGFLTENNGMAIFSTESSETLEKSNVLKNILGLFSTQFYLSNKFIGRDFKKSFALSEWEVIKIKSYNTKARAFLMKRFRNSIVTILNLKEEYFGKFLDPLK